MVERCIRRFVTGIVLGVAAGVCIPSAACARPAGNRENPSSSASFQIWHYKVNRTVLEEPWVLLIRGKNVILYNLADDAKQMKDHSGERPEVVARLKRRLLEWEQKLAVDNGRWKRHTIDDSGRGADGVRLGDANGDGLMDITTGWEEGGVVRVYLNPGPQRACDLWPAVTVGRVKRAEDAVFADLDGDGAMDVVSSCEGGTRTVHVHWAPKEPSEYLNPAAWQTRAFCATAGKQMWMFALPLQIDGRGGIDVVVGSKAEKGQRGEIGWLQSPPEGEPRQVEAWKYHVLCAVGWTMSLEPDDLDGDGDIDVVVSDQMGPGRGVFWLENPGAEAAWAGAAWRAHRILAARAGVNFLTVTDLDRDGKSLTVTDLDRDGKSDILCAGAPPALYWLRRRAGAGDSTEGVAAGWEMRRIRIPEGLRCKAVRVADINLDEKPDIVMTLGGGGDRPSVYWMSYRQSVTEEEW
ncbi:MAG: FG-GAP repeat domain-containing protein, partial [Planctomycetota bacterium]